MLNILKFICGLFLLFILSHSQSWATNLNQKTNLLLNNKSDLALIENYINNIKFLEADFLQEAADKTVINGKLWLSRPGKIRIEYQKPSPILIVANGDVLTYQDLELEETSKLNTSKTPLVFLTRENFSFAALDVELMDFVKSSGLISVSMMKKDKQESGQFTLIFTINPIKFVKMEVKNDLDEITKINFTATKFGEKISDKLFVIKNKNFPQ